MFEVVSYEQDNLVLSMQVSFELMFYIDDLIEWSCFIEFIKRVIQEHEC